VHEPNTMDQLTEEVRGLLPAAHEIHAERHGLQTFTPGTYLPLERRRESAPASARTVCATTMLSSILDTKRSSSGPRSRDTLRGTSTTSSPGAAWMVLGRARGSGSRGSQDSNSEEREKEAKGAGSKS
jgi:hypothetical protein